MAFSGIPLPKVVADVGPGGGIITGMQGANELTKSNLENAYNTIKNKYAPITIPAEAASKLAYANLIGPQFVAKMLGNQDIAANIGDSQLKEAIQSLYKTGMSQPSSSNAFSNLNSQNTQQSSNPLQWLTNKVSNLFNNSDMQSQSQNKLIPRSNRQIPLNEVNNLVYIPSIRKFGTPEQAQALAGSTPGSTIKIDTNGKPIVTTSAEGKTYFEKSGEAAGLKEEGKESGKIRANDIKDLNDIVFNAETKQSTLDDINNMISSPEIRQIRATPLAGRHEMAYYAKFGTRAQQQLVGRLYAQMGNIVKDSSRDFAGQFRKGEQQLLQGMKPNDSDTVDAMIGKAESLSVMNKLLMERSRLTSKIMSKYHINKLEAQEYADKQVNGQSIRDQIHNTLNPKPLDEDINFMAKKYNLSPDEIRKKLKEKGLL